LPANAGCANGSRGQHPRLVARGMMRACSPLGMHRILHTCSARAGSRPRRLLAARCESSDNRVSRRLRAEPAPHPARRSSEEAPPVGSRPFRYLMRSVAFDKLLSLGGHVHSGRGRVRCSGVRARRIRDPRGVRRSDSSPRDRRVLRHQRILRRCIHHCVVRRSRGSRRRSCSIAVGRAATSTPSCSAADRYGRQSPHSFSLRYIFDVPLPRGAEPRTRPV